MKLKNEKLSTLFIQVIDDETYNKLKAEQDARWESARNVTTNFQWVNPA